MKLKCLQNTGSQTCDVIITTVPWTDSNIPLMAPAVLKPIVENAGFSCLAVDANAEIYRATRYHNAKNQIIDFFFDEKIHSVTEFWIRDLFQNMAQDLLAWKPKIIGLSLFSYVSQHATRWLCWHIRKLDPNVKIIIGGAGCLNTFVGPSDFVATLKQQDLIDHHIRGDGEHSLHAFLTGNCSFPGIDSSQWTEMETDQLRRLPVPDYADYDFSMYEKKVLPLVGSRGCVRRCTFCDYIANWKKFQWRTADDIYSEMRHQYHKYGLQSFKFQDSLTNGNVKEFMRLMFLLAQHNTKYQDARFKWSGYYIFRDVTKSTEKDWEIIAASGAEALAVGVENLNEHIRFAIGKKFTNTSIDVHLQYAKKYQIKIQLLNIVGYINETRSDIDFIKQWLIDHTDYKDTLYLQWGGTLGIFPDTWLEKNQDNLGIIRVNQQPQGWINPTTGSTPSLRAAWAKELNQFSKDLGYDVADNIDNHFILETLING